jgi:hypothetical protein
VNWRDRPQDNNSEKSVAGIARRGKIPWASPGHPKKPFWKKKYPVADMDNNTIVTDSSNPHPNDNSSTSPAEPPFQKPDRSKLRSLYSVTQIVRGKLVAYHSAMAKPNAKVIYKDQNNEEVSRDPTPRETMRHMKEILFYSKLSLNQQKIDAGIEDEDDDQPTSLNDLVTEAVENAGERMHEEAMTLGLSCASELPEARVDQIFQEEQDKYRAANPPQSRRGRKKPLEVPPHRRNDWFVPEETQIAIVDRLVDMALPDGQEYQTLQPRERLMASRLLGQFCLLGQQQQLLDMRLHKKKPKTDWDELAQDVETLAAKSIEFHRQDNENFYKTHPRGGRGRPQQPQTEGRL